MQVNKIERWYWRNAPVIYWLPTVLYLAIIWVSSSTPDPEQELLGDSPLRILITAIPLRDKLRHAIIYFFMGILVCMAMNHTRYPVSLGRLRANAIFSFLFGAIYGAMDEIHQHFVPARSMDVFDLFADLVGLLCGIYLTYALTIEYEEFKPSGGGKQRIPR